MNKDRYKFKIQAEFVSRDIPFRQFVEIKGVYLMHLNKKSVQCECV